MTPALLRTILVDDEPRGINSLQKLLQLNCPSVSIVATCTSVEEAIEKVNNLYPDLVFLDIAMPVKNGFDLLRELKEINFEVIFVTAHDQFMIEAFHFSAIDYLLKPVEDDLLVAAVARTQKRINEKTGAENIRALMQNIQLKNAARKMKLCIPSLKGLQIVDLDDILFAESSGNYTNLHFNNQSTLCTSKPMHEYEELLSDSGFIRIHKSYLVNLLHVKEYLRGEGGFVLLSDGKELEVSRRKKDMFVMRMKEYYKF
ncbi:MAG TPA: LytTR family DNA-binding domain-containing protein [Chitinophagaceae bacterium]